MTELRCEGVDFEEAPQTDLSVPAQTAALAAAALLAGCGGGVDAPPAAFFRTERAATKRILNAAPVEAAPVPTVSELLDWAEQAYVGYFPGPASNQVLAPYVYRHYPATGNYVGVAGSDVYVLGPVSGGELLRVGSLADFAAEVAQSRRPSEAQAARFLQQATFGATDADIAAVRAQGFAAWLTAQMGLPRGQRSWDWMAANGYADIDERALYDSGGPTAEAVLAKEAAASADPVRQRVALALSEYFVVSMLVAQLPWTGMGMAHYWDQLQDHAFGNFRELLEAMTLNPAMGAWLNTRGNLKEDPATGRVPDENFAREVMQLFTIGLVQLNLDGTPKRGANGQPLPTYTQDDVTQLARIFTGWDWWDDGRKFFVPVTNNTRPYPEYTRRAMVFDAAKHSTRASVVMGVTIAAGSNGVARLAAALDLLFQHPNVGPFFGRQMIQRLVTSNPSPAYVARVAAAFNNNGAGVRGDLKAVWRAILLDDEARGSASLTSPTHGKVREPMVRVLQWLRSFGVRSRSGRWGYWPIAIGDPRFDFGQRPFASPSVFNWFRPGYIPPGTAMSAAGATAPEFQILNESSTSQWANFIDDLNLVSTDPAQFDWVDWHATFEAERAIAHDARALVQRLNVLLAAGQLSDVNVQRIVEILELGSRLSAQSDQASRRWRVIAAVTLVMICPEYLVQK
jgi:uncharacterized protein (DUF1800 family)